MGRPSNVPQFSVPQRGHLRQYMYCNCYCVYFLRVRDSCPEPVFLNVYGAQESIPRNEFRQPMYSLAGRYDNSIPPRFLAPIDCSLSPHTSVTLTPNRTYKVDLSYTLFSILFDQETHAIYSCPLFEATHMSNAMRRAFFALPDGWGQSARENFLLPRTRINPLFCSIIQLLNGNGQERIFLFRLTYKQLIFDSGLRFAPSQWECSTFLLEEKWSFDSKLQCSFQALNTSMILPTVLYWIHIVHQHICEPSEHHIVSRYLNINVSLYENLYKIGFFVFKNYCVNHSPCMCNTVKVKYL